MIRGGGELVGRQVGGGREAECRDGVIWDGLVLDGFSMRWCEGGMGDGMGLGSDGMGWR